LAILISAANRNDHLLRDDLVDAVAPASYSTTRNEMRSRTVTALVSRMFRVPAPAGGCGV